MLGAGLRGWAGDHHHHIFPPSEADLPRPLLAHSFLDKPFVTPPSLTQSTGAMSHEGVPPQGPPTLEEQAKQAAP